MKMKIQYENKNKVEVLSNRIYNKLEINDEIKIKEKDGLFYFKLNISKEQLDELPPGLQRHITK